METHPTTVYLALGTNLGDRPQNLRRALAALSPVAQPRRASAVYETLPWGIVDQPLFLNMVIEAGTYLAPQALLRELKALERRLGREEGVRYGPRLIDLDILLYDEMVIDLPDLSIPHPRMAERAFVLVPLCDLYPHGRHPRLGETFAALRARLDCSGVTFWAGPEAVWPFAHYPEQEVK
ncbi:2-amino-4-hydroxy-6-hydroxymethyldihydropteridine diphosphokinase [uncultured Thermanaerothrix sp.]|uniref:2-amino-4-hydroxy-6- hydroxymethyldihydropteridine diphosphokinase n=1 Tax=uncultured Thermanaerothrix sp. TaxID=1195149 RepID=UPI00261A7069|nr:2-amino-4-hydroxy-6-hydroxymethyldihydropteridine diphosphokinase [uncultured Thermanaerothrix sp.]